MTLEGFPYFDMFRLAALIALVLLPLSVAGQAVGDRGSAAQRLLTQQPSQFTEVSPGVALPLWRSADGHWLALRVDDDSAASANRTGNPLSLRVVDARSVLGSSLQYGIAPNLQAHAQLSQHSWAGTPTRLVGSELGASYDTSRYSLGLSVGSSTTSGNSLPRILPGGSPGVDGLTSFDSSTQLNARGRLALGSTSGIDLGASTGRIRLLPGNLLGVSTLDQKALSFGVDHGPLSGSVVGRSLQPQAGIPGSLVTDRRWSSIDLGVTWRLPWRGELSVGAQNLWSSGTPVNTPVGPEPDQSRTPYVQYHQDL